MGPALSREEAGCVMACQHSPKVNVSTAKPLGNKRTAPSSGHWPWRRALSGLVRGLLCLPQKALCRLAHGARPKASGTPPRRTSLWFGVCFVFHHALGVAVAPFPSQRLAPPAGDPHFLASSEGHWLCALPPAPEGGWPSLGDLSVATHITFNDRVARWPLSFHGELRTTGPLAVFSRPQVFWRQATRKEPARALTAL